MRILAAAILLIAFPLPAQADYESGKSAWDAGNPAEALAQWQAAADSGDGRAMLELGRLHQQGVGVLQNFVLAHMWFNLAASRGELEAAKERDSLAAAMTAEQLGDAQKRALEWNTAQTGTAAASTGAGAVTESAPIEEKPPPWAIREAQGLLAGLGYRPGIADGVWGPRTARAYADYLRDVGMPESDVLTVDTLRALRETARQHGVVAGAAVSDAAPTELKPDALHQSVLAGDIDGLRNALVLGVDVNARDGNGLTALMLAANKGYVLMIQPLLAAPGVEINARAPDGATALFIAATLGHTEVIERLMEAGADTSAVGPRGMTATDVAKLQYGDSQSENVQVESAAVSALLQGVSSAEFVAELDRQEAERQAELDRQVAERLAELERRNAEELRRKEIDRKMAQIDWTGDCDICPEMVVVPAGKFRMGSYTSEEGRYDNEGPTLRVAISNSFEVGRYEVTFAQWDVCVLDGGCSHRPDDGGWGRENRPVINVSWHDAQEYVKWLSRRTGKRYRLLFEAEWEYVARAGTTGPFHFGSTVSNDQANYDGSYTYGNGKKGVYRRKTVPVGSFPANDFGLHDVHGNAWEWVEDCWHDSYYGAPSDGSAWTWGGDCERRVLRGGSWSSEPNFLRSAFRVKSVAGHRGNGSGFRVARTLAP